MVIAIVSMVSVGLLLIVVSVYSVFVALRAMQRRGEGERSRPGGGGGAVQMRMSTEVDDPEVALAIRHAFAATHPTRSAFDVFYDNGQHYVIDGNTGKVWSVVDVVVGTSFRFEMIARGDEAL